jgi:hypothetical protein
MLVSKLVRTDNVGAGDGFGTKILDRQSEKFLRILPDRKELPGDFKSVLTKNRILFSFCIYRVSQKNMFLAVDRGGFAIKYCVNHERYR